MISTVFGTRVRIRYDSLPTFDFITLLLACFLEADLLDRVSHWLSCNVKLHPPSLRSGSQRRACRQDETASGCVEPDDKLSESSVADDATGIDETARTHFYWVIPEFFPSGSCAGNPKQVTDRRTGIYLSKMERLIVFCGQ